MPTALQVYTRGVGLSTHSDSELITQTLCLDPPGGQGMRPDWPARLTHLMELTPLAYSLLIMDNDRIYGVRDPYGNRPLCLGKVMPDGKRAGSNREPRRRSLVTVLLPRTHSPSRRSPFSRFRDPRRGKG